MRILGIIALVIVLLAGIVAVMAPIGPMPGLFIGGNPTAVPDAWPDTSEVHEVKLKVDGGLPRVVIIWVIDHEGELYVVGSSDSGWVRMIGDASPVQIRIGDNTYEVNASLMATGWEPAMAAYVAKYEPDYPEIVGGFPSVEDAAGVISVFHLDRS